MALRAFFFAVWVFLGGVLSYASLYVFTPFGVALIAAVAIAGLLVWAINVEGRSEVMGLAAGPGLLFIVVATSIGSQALATVGIALVAAVAGVYFVVMRRRCAQSA